MRKIVASATFAIGIGLSAIAGAWAEGYISGTLLEPKATVEDCCVRYSLTSPDFYEPFTRIAMSADLAVRIGDQMVAPIVTPGINGDEPNLPIGYAAP